MRQSRKLFEGQTSRGFESLPLRPKAEPVAGRCAKIIEEAQEAAEAVEPELANLCEVIAATVDVSLVSWKIA